MGRSFLAVVVLCAACTKSPNSASVLVGDVKRALAEREKRLTSYHLVADTSQGEQRAHHEFFFRSPNHSRGVVTTPQAMTVAFDGTTLARLDDNAKVLETYELRLPPERAALLLASTFRPFAPDGFRTPLVPSKGVTAKRITHHDEAAVELTVATQDDDGSPLTVTYVLRPRGDFLAKQTRAGAHLGEVTVEAEQCDQALGLCVPTQLVERYDGQLVGTTALTLVELNPALPQDTFVLSAGPGFTTQKKTLP